MVEDLWESSLARAGSLVVVSGCSPAEVRGFSRPGGFSCKSDVLLETPRLQELWLTDSTVVAPRLWGTGTLAVCTGLMPCTTRDLPGSGTEPASPVAGKFFLAEPPGKPFCQNPKMHTIFETAMPLPEFILQKYS